MAGSALRTPPTLSTPTRTAARPPTRTITRRSRARACPATGSSRPHYPGFMADDIREQVAALAATLTSIEAVLDLPTMHKELEQLEVDAAEPDLWNDQERAQQVTSRMSHLRTDIQRIETLRARVGDVQAAIELEDAALLEEAAAELPQLRREVESLEVRTLLSGEYDQREALITINSGTGGTDAADW